MNRIQHAVIIEQAFRALESSPSNVSASQWELIKAITEDRKKRGMAPATEYSVTQEE